MAPSKSVPSRSLDRGFTLVEIMVSFGLLAIMGTALFGVVVSMQKVAQEDSSRVVANNLAIRELEIARDTFMGKTRGPDRLVINRVVNDNPVPDKYGVVDETSKGKPYFVDGTRYTVTREAQWAAVGVQRSSCDNGSTDELAYLKVEVEVTWPGMEKKNPVTMDTVMTPLKGTYAATTGHLGLKVIDRFGKPREGVSVTATLGGVSKTAQTTDDGCVLFAFLDPGTYIVKLNGPGEVDPTGSPTATRTVTVQSGQIWRGTQEYDGAASLIATFRTNPGHALPTEIGKIPISLGNSALLPNGSKGITGTGTTRTLNNLWPYPSGYQLWGGGCSDADPNEAGDLPVATEPRQTATGSVFLPALEVTVPGSEQLVTATHAADAQCAAYSLQLGKSGTDKLLRTSLPYGTWKLSRAGSTAQTTVSITPAATQTDGTARTEGPVTPVVLP